MGSEHTGRITGVYGNLITVAFTGGVRQNEVAYAGLGDRQLKSEVVRVKGNRAELQVYEETNGLKVGDPVVFSGDLLSAVLGPGLLGKVYDGLQNPLPEVAKAHGFFLERGTSFPPLDPAVSWPFEPVAAPGDRLSAGHFLGHVTEGIFEHRIMVPFSFTGEYRVKEIAGEGSYTVGDTVAELEDGAGRAVPVGLSFTWPVRQPVAVYRQRLRPRVPLITRIRMLDTLFPVARGGTYCIPGPFGAGKTVLQQLTSRQAEVDIVIIAACGERAGEVVETLREFPNIQDPRTGRSLMERTVIICNTSSMPVASRESSVYTAAVIGEYYRQMGLDVLLLADSTSRWAQAMREISGRLEEIPGEEAYPAYLESRIASFYERAGLVRLYDGSTGSLTIGGTVSPAGGSFEEPVTQGTLKVVGAFHGLSRERANARRFPSIDPHESWSNYTGFIDREQEAVARSTLARGREVEQMMKVVGEEGTSLEDYIQYLKAEFLDSVYLQQNGFSEVDGATGRERQEYVFKQVVDILQLPFSLVDKTQALQFFQALRQTFIDWNDAQWGSEKFQEIETALKQMIGEGQPHETGV